MTQPRANDDPPNVAVAIALLGTAGIFMVTGFAQWIAIAAVLAALPVLARRVGDHPAWVSRRDRVPLAIVAVMCAWLLSELLLGRPPASRDNALHLFHIHLLVDELLPSGRLSGWTDSFNNGFAFGEGYPWFGHLWSAAAHLLTGGLVSQRASYAWGLLLIWLLGVLGVWLLAAEVSREVTGDHARARPIAAWAGCIGALAWLLDPGGSREGGWTYLMFHGVWPQLLSATLWVLGLPLVWRALRHPSPRRLGLAALALGGSVLAHPFGLLTLLCSGGMWLVVLIVLPRARALPPGRFAWWVSMHAAAAMIGFAWIATFLSGADALGRSPVPWEPIANLTTELVQGTLFPGHGAWSGPLALVGLLLALRRGGAVAWLTVGLVLGMLIVASQEAVSVLHLDLLVAAFKNVQFPRYSIGVKPLYFALAGAGAAALGQGLATRVGPLTQRTMVERFVMALVLAPFVLALATEPGRLVSRPLGAVDSLRYSDLETDEADLRAALEQEKAALGDRKMVVMFFRAGMGGGMYPAMSVAEVGGALVLDSHVATINTEYRIDDRNPAALVGLGVTHVIHDHALSDKEAPTAAILEAVGTYGTYHLLRVAPKEPVAGGAAVLARGDGEFEVVSSKAGAWEIETRGQTEPMLLRLPFAPHPKWEATLDGEPLELTTSDRWGNAATGLAMLVPHDGRVSIRFVDSPREVQARWLGGIAALLCLGSLAAGRALQVRAWNPSARVARLGWAALVFAIAAGALVVRKRQASQLRETWTTAAGEISATKRLRDVTFVLDAVVDGSLEIARTPERLCIATLSKNHLEGCNEDEHAPQPSFLYVDPYLYRCSRFTVPPKGTAQVLLAGIQSEEWAIGTILRVDRQGKGRKLEYRVGGSWRAIGNKSKDFAVAGPDVVSDQLLEIRNRSSRFEPVCVAVGVVRPGN